jgi:hypothetical protein
LADVCPNLLRKWALRRSVASFAVLALTLPVVVVLQVVVVRPTVLAALVLLLLLVPLVVLVLLLLLVPLVVLVLLAVLVVLVVQAAVVVVLLRVVLQCFRLWSSLLLRLNWLPVLSSLLSLHCPFRGLRIRHHRIVLIAGFF